ncbi:MAG: hypothetical protein M9965_12300 [Anaerolineae bacterium]|nr:hypothetical protein [Anaerolineae bacterium]
MGTQRFRYSWLWVIVLCVVLSSLSAGAVRAQVDGQTKRIQEVHGSINKGTGSETYLLADLKKGQFLTVFVEGTSGDFDPFVALFDESLDRDLMVDAFYAEVNTAIAENRDPLLVIPEFSDATFIAWDDDQPNSFAASFNVMIPADGNYQLFVTSTPLQDTLGDYRVQIGLNAPEVADGNATETGDPIATFLRAGRDTEVAVQELTGELSAEKSEITYNLDQFLPKDTFYAYLESTDAGFRPKIELRAFGAKAIRNGNYNQTGNVGTLDYYLHEGGEGYELIVSACCGDDATFGSYRLLLGRNVPDVLTGMAAVGGKPIAAAPIPVEVGVKLQQLTDINQKSENYGAVYSLRLQWNDPLLRFDPEECQCDLQVYSGDDFARMMSEKDYLWPFFTIFNQQGNRWSQNKNVVVQSNGDAVYFERFSTTLQAPDFNFQRFPFDKQEFFIAVDSLIPTDSFYFVPSKDFTEIGEQLGEEEWFITSVDLSVSEQNASTLSETSRFELRFQARRHAIFYLFRIFLPLVLIIVVAWITFFMDDYGRRAEAAAANLLLFIAYNFTVANDLPRLGYLTYLDTLLACTFAVSVLVVVYNVILKRWENHGKLERARRVDSFMIWLYPIGYLLAFAGATFWFFSGSWGNFSGVV